MLTDAALRNLKPKSKIYKASDRDGMYVTVSPSGTVTFRYDYRLHGRRETLTLGRYGPDGISLAMARELLLEARKSVQAGISPALEKQREKRRVVAIKTFGAAMEAWLANARLKAAANGFHGQLRVALSDGITPSRLPSLLALCRQEEPDVEIRLFEVPLSQQIKGLHDDLYDVGFAQSDEVGDSVVATAVWSDPLMVAVPARHDLLKHKRIPLEEMLRFPLVLGDPQACEGHVRQIERVLRRVDMEPLVVERVASFDLMMTLVSAGFALGLAGEAHITASREPGVVARPLAGRSPVLTTYLLRPAGDLSETLSRFIDRVSAVWAGPEKNDHLDGPPLIVTRTDGATPFRLVTHIGDVGHTLVAGPTGMGKSVLLATLALQFRRYFGSRIFAFDMGRSMRATILGLGGEHYDLGADGGIAFQPLARIDHEGYRSWAAEWVEGRLLHEGVTVAPDEKVAIWSALGSLAGAPQEQRTMTGLSVLLQSNALRQALAPYVLGGAHGKLLDADADRLGFGDVQGFEMEELMHSPAAVQAVLRYLFARFDERFDGAPTLLILDEAWLFLDEPSFAARIRQWLKTLRKKNVSVIFATQSLADIKDSTIAPAIIESCASRIFLPNPQATEPQIRTIYEGFGLNSRQIEIVATAQPKRDYYYQSRLGNRLFDLDLGPAALAFAGASTPQDQRDIDRVLTQAGAPGFAGAWLRHRGLDWAADLLPSAPAAASFLNVQPLEVSP